MLRALTSRPEDQSEAAIAVMVAGAADVLVLGDIDWDYDWAGLRALQAKLSAAGRDYPYLAFPKPVGGLDSGFDLDGDGRLREREDSLGYGRFTGDNGVAVLSRLPLGEVRDHHSLLWATRADLSGLVPPGAEAVVPLASAALWEVEVAGLTVVPFVLSAPVFDGREDRNGKRNRDQILFLQERAQALERPVLIGRGNLDPVDGDGWRAVMARLLRDPALQDPEPRSIGGAQAPNPADHRGDPALDTAAWPWGPRGPGPLRVDYILPGRGLMVRDAGVLWPQPEDAMAETLEQSGANRLIWVELETPPLDPG